MISRRNIRVKVMQTLYSIENLDFEDKKPDPVKILLKQFDQTRDVFLYLVHSLTQIAQYVEIDAKNRASKHLPTEEDLNVNTKLAGNSRLWKMLEYEPYQPALRSSKVDVLEDQEIIKKLYHELIITPEYKEYLAVEGRDKKSEKEILEFILDNIMLPNELYIAFLEENFPNWDDDGSMVIQLVSNFIAKPQSVTLSPFVSAEKRKFATDLLLTAISREEQALELIKPKLKNWDPERIAILDMLLMRLGVCEFLFFETIPPKVTINEYIDIAKEYSTQQSGQFINGILDNIHKDLLSSNKMHKINFK